LEDDMGFGFGEALRLAIRGAAITSPGWNGKGTWWAVRAGDALSGEPLPVYTGPDLGVCRPYLYMRDAQGHEVPWTPSHTDLFRTDYELAPDGVGDPVRAWGLDAIEIAEREGLLLCGQDDDGDELVDLSAEDARDLRWVWLPVDAAEV
jgi:hypothetical protein